MGHLTGITLPHNGRWIVSIRSFTLVFSLACSRIHVHIIPSACEHGQAITQVQVWMPSSTKNKNESNFNATWPIRKFHFFSSGISLIENIVLKFIERKIPFLMCFEMTPTVHWTLKSSMRKEEKWRTGDHPIISNFNLNVFRASNNNNNINKFPPNKRYLVWEWYFQWAIPIRIRHRPRKHSERGQKQHRSTSIQWIVWKSNFHKVNLWTLCLLPSSTLFSACENLSVEFIHSQFGCGLGRTWVCERVCVCVRDVSCHWDAHFPVFLVH